MPRSRIRLWSRSLRIPAAALLAAVLVVTGTAIPVSASAVTGTIYGELIDTAQWGKRAFAQVTVTNLATGARSSAGHDRQYTLTVYPGRYLLEVDISCYATGTVFGRTCVTPLYPGDTAQRSEARIITVEAGDTIRADITTRPGGSISGTIANHAGEEFGASAQAFLIDPSTGKPGSWMRHSIARPEGGYVLTGLPAGDYLVKFVASSNDAIVAASYWDDAGWLSDAQHVTIADESVPVTGIDGAIGDIDISAYRYSGADRFEMAAGIAREYPDDTDLVLVANGLNFPDALSAGPVAARFGAPILLVTPDSVPPAVVAELRRMSPEKIMVVGGPRSVGDVVYRQLAAYSGSIERIAGADRFEASRNLVSAGFDTTKTIYLATGHKFPDALSAGAAAAYEGAPVLLVDGTLGTIDQATSELISRLGVERIVVVGGHVSVTVDLYASLATIPGVLETSRIDGYDRYLAASQLNDATFPAADTVFLATGMNFPDALAGGPLAGAWGAPIYLVEHDCIPEYVLMDIWALHPREIVVLGGPASVSDDVLNLVSCGPWGGVG